MAPDLPSLGIHVVVHRQHQVGLVRLVAAIAATVAYARRAGAVGLVHLSLGDCSPEPVAGPADVARLEEQALTGGLESFSYEVFGANLGAGGGANRLALGRCDDFVLVLHPDTYPAPTFLGLLLEPFCDPTVGAADARQLPVEHPKDFDHVTGGTSWVSGSCMLARGDVFRGLGGFDAGHFVLCGGDVDFSWRARLKGMRTVHDPRAVVFRDRRIEADATVAVASAEVYHTTLAGLLLAHRYGRPDLVAATVGALAETGTYDEQAAVAEWRTRVAAGNLPEVMPEGAMVAQFVDGHHARHRF